MLPRSKTWEDVQLNMAFPMLDPQERDEMPRAMDLCSGFRIDATNPKMLYIYIM